MTIFHIVQKKIKESEKPEVIYKMDYRLLVIVCLRISVCIYDYEPSLKDLINTYFQIEKAK